MRAAFLVDVSTAKSGEGQADGRHGLTTMNANEPDEPDELDDDDDDDDDDDFVDDDEDSGDDDENDGEDEEEDEEPETWQVRSRALGRAVALPRITPAAGAKRP
jgi:hypothetical protein